VRFRFTTSFLRIVFAAFANTLFAYIPAVTTSGPMAIRSFSTSLKALPLAKA
jgi:hypothetical protein